MKLHIVTSCTGTHHHLIESIICNIMFNMLLLEFEMAFLSFAAAIPRLPTCPPHGTGSGDVSSPICAITVWRSHSVSSTFVSAGTLT